MQKVIGLDIGSYSIKAVEIVNTFKSYEITNFYEVVIPNIEGVPLDAIVPVCMEQLFRENDLKADRILTAMPGQFISSRVLPFNFSDPRKIEASIMVELEDQVPFNMDDMIIDHQILGTAYGKTMALAVMTRKTFLKNFLDLLSRINIDPKLIDVDSLAFYNISSEVTENDDLNYALVDIGNEKTTVCIVRNGLLRMFRSINLGGRYITDFLARDLQVDFAEAQRIKHAVSRVQVGDQSLDDLSPRDRTVVERMTLAVNSIVKELGRTFYSYKNWDKQEISKVIISGGTSLITDFDTFLSKQLEVDVEKFTLQKSNLNFNPSLELNEAKLAQSLAIGIRAVSNVKKHSQINLRRGEFAYVQNYESVMKVFTRVAKVISVIITLLMVSYIFKFYQYNSQIENIKKEYKAEYLRSFPALKKQYKKKNVTFKKLRKDAENKLKGEIRSKQDAISEFQIANSGSGALVSLYEMSKLMPKDVKVDITSFDYRSVGGGSGKLSIRAETDNFSSQSKIIEALTKVPVFKNVKEKNSGTKPGSGGKVIEFTVDANYEANI